MHKKSAYYYVNKEMTDEKSTMAKVMAWSQLPLNPCWLQALSSKKTAFSPQYILHPRENELSYQVESTNNFNIFTLIHTKHVFIQNVQNEDTHKQQWLLKEGNSEKIKMDIPVSINVSSKATQNHLDSTVNVIAWKINPILPSNGSCSLTLKNTKTIMKKPSQDKDCSS